MHLLDLLSGAGELDPEGALTLAGTAVRAQKTRGLLSHGRPGTRWHLPSWPVCRGPPPLYTLLRLCGAPTPLGGQRHADTVGLQGDPGLVAEQVRRESAAPVPGRGARVSCRQATAEQDSS